MRDCCWRYSRSKRTQKAMQIVELPFYNGTSYDGRMMFMLLGDDVYCFMSTADVDALKRVTILLSTKYVMNIAVFCRQRLMRGISQFDVSFCDEL